MTKRKRGSTANIEPHEPNHEYLTPTKAKAQGAIGFISAKGLLKKNRNTKPTDILQIKAVKQPAGATSAFGSHCILGTLARQQSPRYHQPRQPRPS